VTIVVGALVVVVILLAILVAGLLRSHATILRRLHELGAGTELDPGVRVATPDPGTPTTTRVVPRTDGTVPAPSPDVPDGRPATDVSGVGPRGEAIAARVVGVEHDTVLVFLSSGCTTCLGFWEDLASPQLPDGTRLLIVTRGVEEESPSAVLELAPPGATVIMSSSAWDELRVPGSPFVVLAHGPSGRVVGEGTAESWAQVLALFLRAGGDGRLGSRDKAGADRRREQELDRILLASGIAPGDPSLYRSSDATPADAAAAETTPDAATEER
jgi:hypothetical protein